MAVFPTSIDVQVQLSGSTGSWTSLAADLRADVAIKCDYGIHGSRVDDRVAGVGTLEFALNNSQRNSATTLGYYSPYNGSLRSGFYVGAGARLTITYSGSTFVKHVGRIAGIDPIPGQYGERSTLVTSTDWIDEAATWKISGLSTMVSSRADEAAACLIRNIPVPPTASTLATAGMTLPYLNIAVRDEETTVLQELDRLARTEFGYVYVRGNTASGGELVFEDRRSRFNAACPIVTITNEMISMSAPLSRENGFSYLRTTVHPRRADDNDQVVIFYLDEPVTIGASETVNLNCGFRDPNEQSTRIGATDITTPVATTDYLFGTGPADNSLIANLSASFVVTSNGVEATLRNGGAISGVLSQLQVRGRGLYDYQPVRVEMSSGSSAQGRFGGQILDYDMAYLDNPSTASAIGQYIIDHYANAQHQMVERVGWWANSSSALMVAALQAEPGARIALAETVGGISTTFYIQGVALTIGKRGQIYCELDLIQDAEATLNGNYWILGTSTLGVSTRLAL